MRDLAPSAALDYVDLTLRALDAGLIDQSEVVARVRVLRSLLGGVDLRAFQGKEEPETRESESCWPACGEPLIADDRAASARESESALFHLSLAQVVGELSDWVSHKGDPDPHPSVPHAHSRSDPRRKVDLYRGYVYHVRARVGRIRRPPLVALWNHNPFRQFAREALDHFIRANPSHRFRVKHPRRLPRK